MLAGILDRFGFFWLLAGFQGKKAYHDLLGVREFLDETLNESLLLLLQLRAWNGSTLDFVYRYFACYFLRERPEDVAVLTALALTHFSRLAELDAVDLVEDDLQALALLLEQVLEGLRDPVQADPGDSVRRKDGVEAELLAEALLDVGVVVEHSGEERCGEFPQLAIAVIVHRFNDCLDAFRTKES